MCLFELFNVYLVQAAGVYHLASFLAVVLCLVVTIFSTIKGYEEISFTVLFYLESVILVQYSLEYILRLWSCGTHGRFKGFKGMALPALESRVTDVPKFFNFYLNLLSPG